MSNALAWKPLSEIDARPIVFLDKPVWQQAAFHLLVGRKNSGKGTFLAGEAARVTRGDLGGRRNVIWIASGEDSYAIDVRPRIEAADGLVENITVLQNKLLLPTHVNDLYRKAQEIGDVGLIVIDPLSGCLRQGKSSNFDSDVREAIACLNSLADRLQCIVVGVRHLTNKEITGGVLAGVLGSSDWTNVPRVVLALIQDNQDENLRHLTIVTGNRVKRGTGRLYRIEGVQPATGGEEVTRAIHVGDSHRDADDLLENGQQPTSRSSQARDLILDTLEQAPERQMESDTLDALIADQAGLAVGSIKNQRTQLKKAGLIRYIRITDEHGQITGWIVARTNAPREAA